eukprot:7669072-Pyramimonas_sp.AAC.1
MGERSSLLLSNACGTVHPCGAVAPSPGPAGRNILLESDPPQQRSTNCGAPRNVFVAMTMPFLGDLCRSA